MRAAAGARRAAATGLHRGRHLLFDSRVFGGVLGLLGYTATRWALLPHGATPWSSHVLLGKGSDPGQYVWSLAWWPYALAHGLNPFITRLVWAPRGFNLTWDASIPFLALLAWPVTALAGPLVAFNVLTFLAPVTAGIAAYLLCLTLVRKPLAAVVGGWLFAFSSYEMAQSQSHLNLDWTVAVPLVGWLTVLRYRQAVGAKTYITATAAMLACEFGTSIEVFATLTLFALGSWVMALALVADQRQRLLALARDGALAYVIWAIICLPYLVYFAMGASQVPAEIRSAATYSTDLLNFVLPTPITAIGGAAAHSLTAHFTGNFGEDGGYVGLPLLGIVGYFAFTGRRAAWSATATVVLGLTAIATLGPRLHVLGTIGVRLPWLVATHLPLIKSALPARLTLYIALFVAIMTASVLVRTSRRRWLAAALAVLAVASTWPTTLPAPAVRPPTWVSSRLYRKLVRPSATLVLLPYGSTGNSMLWQEMSGFYFRMAGGYTTIVPLSFSSQVTVQWFFDNRPSEAPGPELERFCVAHGVSALIVDLDRSRGWAAVLARLGWRHVRVGQSIIFWVPRRAA